MNINNPKNGELRVWYPGDFAFGRRAAPVVVTIPNESLARMTAADVEAIIAPSAFAKLGIFVAWDPVKRRIATGRTIELARAELEAPDGGV